MSDDSLSLLYCITPTMYSLWTKRSYHSSRMLFFKSLHHLHLSTLEHFSLPAKICMFGESPHHDASRNVSQQGFSSRHGKRPGPTENLYPVCVFNLKLLSLKLQFSLHMTAFVVLNVSQQLAIMAYRCSTAC